MSACVYIYVQVVCSTYMCVWSACPYTRQTYKYNVYNAQAVHVHVHVYTHATILIDKSLANQKKKAVGIIIWMFHLYLSHCILKLVN